MREALTFRGTHQIRLRFWLWEISVIHWRASSPTFQGQKLLSTFAMWQGRSSMMLLKVIFCLILSFHSSLVFLITSWSQFIDDENLTLTKFKTFEVRMFYKIFFSRFSISLKWISTGLSKKFLMLGWTIHEVLKTFCSLAMVDSFTILSVVLNCPSSSRVLSTRWRFTPTLWVRNW